MPRAIGPVATFRGRRHVPGGTAFNIGVEEVERYRAIGFQILDDVEVPAKVGGKAPAPDEPETAPTPEADDADTIASLQESEGDQPPVFPDEPETAPTIKAPDAEPMKGRATARKGGPRK